MTSEHHRGACRFMYGKVTISATPAHSFSFSSTAFWPMENFDDAVHRGLLDLGVMRLKSCITLASVMLLLATSVSAQIGKQVEDTQHMIGLLEVPRLFGIYNLDSPSASPSSQGAIKLYSAPTTKAGVMAVAEKPEDIEAAEHAYEEKSAVTYKRHTGWYLIGVSTNSGTTKGWISAREAGAFYSLGRLLLRSMSYLTEHWDKRLWTLPTTLSRNKRIAIKGYGRPVHYDVNVISAKKKGHQLWLRVELLGPGRCSGVEPKVIAKGWIPAYSRRGNLNAWFYSRGC